MQLFALSQLDWNNTSGFTMPDNQPSRRTFLSGAAMLTASLLVPSPTKATSYQTVQVNPKLLPDRVAKIIFELGRIECLVENSLTAMPGDTLKEAIFEVLPAIIECKQLKKKGEKLSEKMLNYDQNGAVDISDRVIALALFKAGRRLKDFGDFIYGDNGFAEIYDNIKRKPEILLPVSKQMIQAGDQIAQLVTVPAKDMPKTIVGYEAEQDKVKDQIKKYLTDDNLALVDNPISCAKQILKSGDLTEQQNFKFIAEIAADAVELGIRAVKGYYLQNPPTPASGLSRPVQASNQKPNLFQPG